MRAGGRADGQTNMTKLIVTSCSFAKLTKKIVYASNHKKFKMWIILLLKQVTSLIECSSVTTQNRSTGITPRLIWQLLPTVPVHFLVETYPLHAVIFECGYIFQFNRTTNSKWAIFWLKWAIYTAIYCISTVNTRHMQIPDVLVKLGYIWRHVSAVNRPSSGQVVVLLR